MIVFCVLLFQGGMKMKKQIRRQLVLLVNDILAVWVFLCNWWNPKPALEIGRTYYIETITYYYAGVLESFSDKWVVISNVSRIWSAGNHQEFLETGYANDASTLPDNVTINRESITLITFWRHHLPVRNKGDYQDNGRPATKVKKS